jgi:hypothetical protein
MFPAQVVTSDPDRAAFEVEYWGFAWPGTGSSGE